MTIRRLVDNLFLMASSIDQRHQAIDLMALSFYLTNYLIFFQLTIKEPSVSSISRRRPRSITKKRPLKGSEFARSGIDVCETEIISLVDIH